MLKFCRKFLILLVLLAANLVLAEAQTAADSGECERVEYYDWTIGNMKSCFMDRETSIDSEGFQISTKDETIQGLRMENNKNVEFLPESPSRLFENLIGYNAEKCSIKQISYKNFKNLIKLQVLWLKKNEIEMIPSDAFKDLSSLEMLGLRKINFCFHFD
jgi:hypothetical protein